MTVSTEVDHNDYIGNGVTTVFPYQFRIFKAADLTVVTVDLNENLRELILGTDYTVTGAGSYQGGNVVLASALDNGWKISISRELPVTQETDLRNQGKFFAEVHENAFDKLTMLIQQTFSRFSLALRKPSFIANYYDALNNRIRNLRDPSQAQDAATKHYVDSLANTNLNKTLRVPEPFISILPNVEGRRNKTLSFDNSGSPLLLDPASSGLWGYALIDSFQIGAVITTRFQALHWSLPDGDGEYYRWDGALPKTVPAGSTPESTGGIGAGAWVGIGDASLRFALAAEDGGSLIGLKRKNLTGSLKTDLDSYYQASPINAITDYGLVPDFDPTTGVANGTNNTAKLQALMDALIASGGNKTVIIPAGNYYFNFDATPNTGGVGVMWGRVGAGLKNVTFLCYGVVFYSGSTGRFNGVFGAKGNIKINGLNVIGYGGGALTSSRERDACFTINYNSIGVKFNDCYMDNSLGDCIYIGGSLVSGGELGYTSRDIEICGCTLKERFGNGVRSFNGGSRSRVAVAIVDVTGLSIYNCTIYGEIDFEPNLNGQSLQNIDIHDIKFRSGVVIPNPANPFEVEPLYVGNQTIRGGISVQSIAASVNATNINIQDISFEYGRFSIHITPSAINIDNIRMRRGIFLIGNSAGTNYATGFKIKNSYVELPLNGQDDDFNEDGVQDVIPAVMFWLKGNIAFSNFCNNMCGTPSSGLSYMFYTSNVSSANDIGRNTFSNNAMVGGGAIFNFPVNINSIELSNSSMNSSSQSLPSTTTQSVRTLLTEEVSIPLSSDGGISWSAFQGCKWKLIPNAARSMSGIANGPKIGMEIQLRGSGAFPITLVSSGTFYLKGGVNAVLDSGRKIITMQLIDTSTWTEINRNF